MKSIILVALVMSFLLSPLVGKDSTNKGKLKYTATIEFISDPYSRQKGELYDTYDTAISLISMYDYKSHYYKLQLGMMSKDLSTAESDLINIPAEDIYGMTFRKNGNVWTGILLGTLTGITIGVIHGQKLGDDPPGVMFNLPSFTANEKSTGFGFVYTL